MDIPPPRGRRSTLPPTGDLAARVAVLERGEDHQREIIQAIKDDLDGIGENISAFGKVVDGIEKQMILLNDDRINALKSRDRWKNWWLGISSTLAVSLIIALVTIAWRVQSARLP
jgi:hypothetical protein